MTPKSLLRAACVALDASTELETGSFQHVIDDAAVEDPAAVRRIVLCSGKIAHEAAQRIGPIFRRDDAAQVAVVRVEQLYPWPVQLLDRLFERYGEATRWSGSRRSPRTWAPGPSCTPASTPACPSGSDCAM